MVTQVKPEELYAELEYFLREGDIDRSLQLLDQVCRHFKDHGGAWELRGLLEAKANRPNLAVRYLEQASQLTELEPVSVRTMAIQYLAIDKIDSGINTLQSLGLSGRLSVGMLRVVSHDLLTLGRPEVAAQVIWSALKSEPDSAALWHELSAIQSVLGESPDVCLQAVQHAIRLAPEATEYRVTAATLLIRMDQVQAAYEAVSSTVSAGEIELDCPCCLWRLICIFETFDDHGRMEVCYDRLRQVEAEKTFR